MKVNKAATLLPPILAALAIAALTLYAYRGLAARPFAADDYQWLLGVRGLGLGALLRRAFDPSAQAHFFRPLIWLLFWAQTRAFGLDPRGFHAVSLALHLLNASLLGWLAYRLTDDEGRRTNDEKQFAWSSVLRLSSALAATAIVALHPAPFEAVVWISAQSELLAAALLLVALLLWTKDEGRTTKDDDDHHSIVYRLLSIVGGWPALLASLALGLALLAKESAVIGLPLLMLLGWRTRGRGRETGDRGQGTTIDPHGVMNDLHGTGNDRHGTANDSHGAANEQQGITNEPHGTINDPQGITNEPHGTMNDPQGITNEPHGTTIDSQGVTNEPQGTRNKWQGANAVKQFSIFNIQFSVLDVAPYILPTALTIAYIALQVIIERRNYLLAQGGYGIGTQLVLNPLRSLALIIAPLPGTEHADATWLAPVGAAVAIVLAGLAIYNLRSALRDRQDLSSSVGHRWSVGLILALALTLLPTAPFASPPDSRYLYLPVMAGALLISLRIDGRRKTKDQTPSTIQALRPSSFVLRPMVDLGSLVLAVALAWWASGELHAREGRFAAASGPGGSLWQVATWACAESRPERMVVVEPPVAAPHVEAIVALACGPGVRTKIVGPDQVEGAIKQHTIVIAFPNGSAEVQRRT